MKTVRGVLAAIDSILEDLLDGERDIQTLSEGHDPEEFRHALQDCMFSGMVQMVRTGVVKRIA